MLTNNIMKTLGDKKIIFIMAGFYRIQPYLSYEISTGMLQPLARDEEKPLYDQAT